MSAVRESGEPNHLATVITCHCWNGNHTQVALCPGNNEIHIYQATGSGADRRFERVDVLVEHEQLVSSLDWSPTTNRIVSCSHDRNAYVWNFVGGKWLPSLCVLRNFHRAVHCVKWSPQEDKFAVGSARCVSFCVFEAENNWWLSKTCKDQPEASNLCVAWHPSNLFMATGTTDRRVVVYSAAVKGLDRKNLVEPYKVMSCGDVVATYQSGGFVHAVSWNQDGSWLAFVSHDCSVSFVPMVPGGQVQVVYSISGSLPFASMMFLSPTALVAAGHDCNPQLFTLHGNTWAFERKLDPETRQQPAATSDVQDAFHKFERQSSSIRSVSNKMLRTRHQDSITCLQPVAATDGRVTCFSSSAIDGRLYLWSI